MDAFTAESKAKADESSKRIIGAAIEVHRTLGSGLINFNVPVLKDGIARRVLG